MHRWLFIRSVVIPAKQIPMDEQDHHPNHRRTMTEQLVLHMWRRWSYSYYSVPERQFRLDDIILSHMSFSTSQDEEYNVHAGVLHTAF